MNERGRSHDHVNTHLFGHPSRSRDIDIDANSLFGLLKIIRDSHVLGVLLQIIEQLLEIGTISVKNDVSIKVVANQTPNPQLVQKR